MGYAVRTKKGVTRVVKVDADGYYLSDGKKCKESVYSTKHQAQKAKENSFGDGWPTRRGPMKKKRSKRGSRSSYKKSGRGRIFIARSKKINDPMKFFMGDGQPRYLPVRYDEDAWKIYEVIQVRDRTNNKYGQFIKVPTDDGTRVKRLPDDVDENNPYFLLYKTPDHAVEFGIDDRLSYDLFNTSITPEWNIDGLPDVTSYISADKNAMVDDYLQSSSADFWNSGSFVDPDDSYFSKSLISDAFKGHDDKIKSYSTPYKKSKKSRPDKSILDSFSDVMPRSKRFKTTSGGANLYDSLTSF